MVFIYVLTRSRSRTLARGVVSLGSVKKGDASLPSVQKIKNKIKQKKIEIWSSALRRRRITVRLRNRHSERYGGFLFSLSLSLRSDRLLRMALREVVGGALSWVVFIFYFGTVTVMSYTFSRLSCL